MRENIESAELIYVTGGERRLSRTGVIQQRAYPFGEPLVLHEDVPHPLEPIRTIVSRPSSVSALMQMLWFVDAYAERGFQVPNLVLPHVLGARQDRMNDEGDYLFTAKSVAREINLRNFPSVTVYDPHSDVISGLIDRCRVVKVAEILRSALCTQNPFSMGWYSAIIAPDEGAQKRAGGVAQAWGLPLIQGRKKRDVATGKLTGFGVEKIDKSILDQQKRLLIVDDLCDGGGTFNGLADAIHEQYPDIWLDLYVTHGIFSKGMDELWPRFKNVITTNSIVRDEEVDTTVIDLLR